LSIAGNHKSLLGGADIAKSMRENRAAADYADFRGSNSMITKNKSEKLVCKPPRIQPKAFVFALDPRKSAAKGVSGLTLFHSAG
jgi:hypothetical protein